MIPRRDVFSRKKRSEIMSHIRSKYTKLDLVMANTLKKGRFAFTMYPKVVGNPDFLVEKKVAVFCDSSFWHGRNWRTLKKRLREGNNAQYWVGHIQANKKRDRYVTSTLAKLGYTVIRFWDDEIVRDPELCIYKIRETLRSTCPQYHKM